jgi:hypothetical protein
MTKKQYIEKLKTEFHTHCLTRDCMECKYYKNGGSTCFIKFLNDKLYKQYKELNK